MLAPDVGLYCLEVGKGSAAAIIEPIPGRSPQELQAVLIDVAEPNVEVAKWLLNVGVVRLAAIILTHNDRDHIGSLYEVIHAFKPNKGMPPKIGKIRFILDRGSAPAFWVDAKRWCDDGWIDDADLLGTPVWSRPRRGELVVGPPDTTFGVYCVYPPRMFWADLVARFQLISRLFSSGKNQLSAVLRVAPPSDPDNTQVLFGGDLDYKGWHYLANSGWNLRSPVFVLPHHGGPQRSTRKFGAQHLVDATRPTYAIVSVGSANTDGHPHEDIVNELRKKGGAVLCTQITPRCLSATLTPLPLGAVFPREIKNPRLCVAGTACAGTVVVSFTKGGPTVHRLIDHQRAVDRLPASGHTPLCRR